MTDRAREMVARLGREWHDAGFSTEDRAGLVERATEVMAIRASRFGDDHHPVFLHPLRTVLLLLEIGETDSRAHTSALLIDSESGGPASRLVLDPFPEAASEVFEAGEDERLERLLLADAWVRRTWLVERLDHVRHLHLWAGPARTRDAIERAELEEAPLATREGGRLQRAWADWMDKARRHRLVERAESRPIGTGGSSPTAP
jgi:hypothetical protein